MEDDRGMAMEFESMVCIQNLGGRQMLRFMRAGLCGGGVGGGSGVFQRMFLVTKVLVPNIKQVKTRQSKNGTRRCNMWLPCPSLVAPLCVLYIKSCVWNRKQK